jgi:hypothetical protein
MGARAEIRLDECGLLTRRNAMRWCGQLGDERFDREVVPVCAPRYIGQERFYSIDDLRAWRDALPVDRLGRAPQAPAEDDWEKLRNDLRKDRRNQARPG